MNNYEFWDELGNIFEAVLAYQKKAVEFNNHFITPWIRLGNVFDRGDHNQEAIEGFQKATELAPENAQNWISLGDSYFRAGAFEDAANAYDKAIVLDPQAGWPHSNLALSLASQGKLEESIPLYIKSLQLLTDDREKAISWNRLGNVYRRLNDYDNAVLAFQQADNLDSENTGFHDQLEEILNEPSVLAEDLNICLNQELMFDAAAIPTVAENTSSECELVDESASNEMSAKPGTIQQMDAILPSEMPDMMAIELDSDISLRQDQSGPVEGTVTDLPETRGSADELPTKVEEKVPERALEALSSDATDIADAAVKTLTRTYLDLVETYSDGVTVATDAVRHLSTEQVPVETTAEVHNEPMAAISGTDAVALPDQTPIIDDMVAVEDIIPVDPPPADSLKSTVQEEASEKVVLIADVMSKSIEEILADEEVAAMLSKPNITDEAAYEEYLNDTIVPLKHASNDAQEETVDKKPLAQLDDFGDVKIEMDTKNAHVWNELGNIYFNSGNYDDAISSYGKAIELDRQFAWSYSNLALAYVQKGRFAEAVLLYQRSIELCMDETDKAITWNRLGNVYRRQGDYYNAILAYQTADALDPDNTALSLKSRFTLLGSSNVEQIPNYVL